MLKPSSYRITFFEKGKEVGGSLVQSGPEAWRTVDAWNHGGPDRRCQVQVERQAPVERLETPPPGELLLQAPGR